MNNQLNIFIKDSKNYDRNIIIVMQYNDSSFKYFYLIFN